LHSRINLLALIGKEQKIFILVLLLLLSQSLEHMPIDGFLMQ
jgi:hypothetical protein